MKKHIFKLHDRLDYVGIGERVLDKLLGDCVRITDCYNIRRWGTSAGLGELAIKGKLENTVLDKHPPITIRLEEIIHTIDVHDDVAKSFKNDE